nr:integrase, catalytic region, zinc finger, CCHC-type, peptidase aspartic, catalytic [Tanacetum cinerariifolium]
KNRQIAQPGMNIGQDRQMQMIGGCSESKSSECWKLEWANWCSRKWNSESDWEWPRRRDAAYLQTQLLIAQKEEAGIQLQAEEYDLMAAAADLDEIEEVNANCILMANLQQASSSDTQTDNTLVYDSDGSAEFMGSVRFGNDHVAAILGFGDLQWGIILITRVYFVEGLGHNLFSVGQFSSLKSEANIIYKNAKLRTQLFKKVSDQKDNTHDTSENTKFVKQPIVENLPKGGGSHALSKPVTSNLVSTPQESIGVNNDRVISPRMFKINPFMTFREESMCLTQKKQKAKVTFKENQIKYQPKITKPKKKFMGTVRFENDHVAAILGFGDLQWGNILITRVYFVEGLGYNLFSVGQFCDSDLEVAFREMIVSSET